jgi:hypothetical protein
MLEIGRGKRKEGERRSGPPAVKRAGLKRKERGFGERV